VGLLSFEKGRGQKISRQRQEQQAMYRCWWLLQCQKENDRNTPIKITRTSNHRRPRRSTTTFWQSPLFAGRTSRTTVVRIEGCLHLITVALLLRCFGNPTWRFFRGIVFLFSIMLIFYYYIQNIKYGMDAQTSIHHQSQQIVYLQWSLIGFVRWSERQSKGLGYWYVLRSCF